MCDLAIQNLSYYKHRIGYIENGEMKFKDDDVAIDPNNDKVMKFKNRKIKAEKLLEKQKTKRIT